jgi:HD-GYP domain-containing protein (c-di-GMP phosphodiesterase class II)
MPPFVEPASVAVPPLPPGATLSFASGQGAAAAAPSLAEILSSLSRALDLTEGQPMGHAVKVCLIALRIADELGLGERDRADLHLAMLLKDAGCSSNAAKMFALFGCDDLSAKCDSKVSDWCRLSEAAKFAVLHVGGPHASAGERLRKLRDLLRLPGRVMDALTEARCTRGADIARTLGLSKQTVDAIYHLDEHWDGQGAPHGRRGEEIPLLGRIACLSQTLEVFVTTYGVPQAYKIARQRAGRWFDPELVRAAGAFEADRAFWDEVRTRPRALLQERTGGLLRGRMTEATLDAVCDAFAGIVDAKSSFTGAHSSRVAEIAARIGTRLGLPSARVTTLRRAGLLHDLGKLAVPNLILDKPGALTDAEFAVVKRHPFYTEQVLLTIPSFSRLTEIAAAHHEKLDGSGYFRGLAAPDLDLDMRVLAVADVYDALSAERPYRGALPTEKVFEILDRDAGMKLDADCVEALK